MPLHLRKCLRSIRFPFARRLFPFPGRSGGHRSISSDDLAINFSHVLHEPADHPSVQAAVEAAGKRQHVAAHPEVVSDGIINGPVDVWLTVSVGLPDRLPDLLDVNSASIMLIDLGSNPVRECTFFGAPARLTLPEPGSTVGIAAAILRPGGRSVQLVARGPFEMPEYEPQAIRELESIIQAHADQWRPTSPLWEQGFSQTRGRSDAGSRSY